MGSKSLKKGAIILVLAGFINRLIGFLYRILMVRLVGSEGIGLFQMILPVFNFIIVLTTAGIPPTVSKLISEAVALGEKRKAQKIFKVALLTLTFSSIVITALSIITAPYVIKNYFADSRTFLAYLSLLPSIIVISYSSVFRGYFMGQKEMFFPAFSQVIETVSRFLVGLLSASYLLKYGIHMAVVGFSIGLVIGEVFGLLTLLIAYINKKPRSVKARGSTRIILKNMYSLALPITINRIIATLVSTLHAFIIPLKLQAFGFTLREATSLYGQLTGMAFTLVYFPTVFTVSLATTLVPAISEAQATKNNLLVSKRSVLAIKYTLLAGIPWVIIFYILAPELTTFLFNCPEAGKPLKILALGCIFIYLQQTTNGLLQGMGKVNIILKNSLMGALINVISVYYLTLFYGVEGTAMALNISAFFVAALNLRFLFKEIGIYIHFKNLKVLSIITLLTTASIWYLKKLLKISIYKNGPIIIFLIILGLIVYIIVLILLGMVRLKDIRKLPFVEDILKFID